MKKLIVSTALAATLALPVSAETNFIANSFYDAAVPMSQQGYIQWAELVKELSGGIATGHPRRRALTKENDQATA